jgi:hypothetical protein
MFEIPCILADQRGVSFFSTAEYPKNDRDGMLLSEQIAAKNFRFRESEAGYATDWHLAGDPTLIIIQKGILRIWLQNGSFKDFGPGSQFIAADNLSEGVIFDPTKHGHKAEVIGSETLFAIHIKLAGFNPVYALGNLLRP